MPKASLFQALTNRTDKGAAKPFALPDDGFVMLIPRGEAPNLTSDGKKVIQVVDEEALTLIMSGLLNRGGEMLVDDEHHSHDADKVTDANAWLELGSGTLQLRKDGLWGDPRWSTKGLANVEGGVKRYVSPEFPESSLVHLGGNRYRVTELTGLALTNRPGFRRLQKPLTNREDDPNSSPSENHNTMHKKALARALGLTEAVLDTLDETTLLNRAQDLHTKAASADTLKAEITILQNREVEAFMEANKDVIPGDAKETVKGMFLSNRAGAESVVKGFKSAKGEPLTEEQKRRATKTHMFNRDGGGVTPPAADSEEAKTNALHNRATAYRATHRVSYDEALSAVRNEAE